MQKDLAKNKVFVGMSGGVDSSVTAYLLKKEGYDVAGVFMRCFNVDGCAEKDAEDARRVAGHLGIPFYVWDFEKEYKKRVVEYMVEGYRKGETPNPDVMCNKEIKFGLFLRRALEMGADYVATGHYVRRRPFVRTGDSFAPAAKARLRSPRPNSARGGDQAPGESESFLQKNAAALISLFEGKDTNKDQSYFLWTLTQEQLHHCLFPIGDYLKSEVREIAQSAGLPTAEKKDSQGICFLGKITLADFLKQYIPEKRGAVLNIRGEKIGEHDGAHFYTLGQRHGLVSGSWYLGAGSGNRKPVYVAEKNVSTNTLMVVEGDANPALYKNEIHLRGVNFVDSYHSPIRAPARQSSGDGGNWRMGVFVRVRYRQPLAKAEVRSQKSEVRLIFDNPQKFVAPGQSAVFYAKTGEMIGGGVIMQ